MKKSILLVTFFLISTFGFSQTKPYPIPSYNVLVSSLTFFQESSSQNNKAKKDIHVQVNCAGKADTTCCASVVIYSLGGDFHYGPFRIYCGETLVQPVEEGEWGVAVDSECQVTVSVWITGEKNIEKYKEINEYGVH